jgi:hypothetical protein
MSQKCGFSCPIPLVFFEKMWVFWIHHPGFLGALIQKKNPDGGRKWKNHVGSHVKKRFLPFISSIVVLSD